MGRIVFLCLLSFTMLVEGYENQQTKKDYLLLITGCGRSGTTFMATVLQKCGLDIQHELLGADGTVSFPHAVPADMVPSWGMDGYPNIPGLNKCRFRHIFQQVRDPLKVISSAAVDLERCRKFINKYIPEIKSQDPPLIKGAKYWYYWNLYAEKIAHWTYRIEDIDRVWGEFCDRIGYDLDKKILKKIPKNYNSRKVVHRTTWAELKAILDPELYKNVVKMARRYGYPVKDKN